MIYGYARVSSKEQNLERQLLELRKYVEEDHIITDKESGKDLNREGYIALKGRFGLRRGDVLYIKSLDRLSRNKIDIKQELEWFKQEGVRLIILDLPTTNIQVPEGQEWILDMINNIIIEVMASIAEQERMTIRKRQAEGIAAAKMAGKHMGRPKVEYPKKWNVYYERWKANEITAKFAMDSMNLSRTTFYRLVKQYEKRNVSKG